jgi:hypothetical protein
MSWSTPKKSLAINNLKNLLKCKMHAYWALGTDEASLPTTMEQLTALYAGETLPSCPWGICTKILSSGAGAERQKRCTLGRSVAF